MATAEKMYCYRHPDRETGVSCSECGRGICPDCMVFAPVGIRCPEHAGVAQGAAKVTTGVRRAAYEGGGALVTKTLIAINVLVFFVNLAQGSTLSRVSGSLFERGALYIGSPFTSGLADGEWWRLITSAFLHGSLIHLGMNMLVLWIVGTPVEQAIGRGRFLSLYIVSGLAGGALAMLALSRFGRAHAIYGRPGLIGVAGLIAVGLASVLVAYMRVQGYT
jgi:membrane associated rhomboid family serine protease